MPKIFNLIFELCKDLIRTLKVLRCNFVQDFLIGCLATDVRIHFNLKVLTNSTASSSFS